MRRLLIGAITGLCGAALAPASGLAATHLGSTFVPGTLCGTDTTIIQTVTGGPLYSAPFSGVITSWSFQPGATVPSTMKLKVGRTQVGSNLATDTNITIVGESAPETPTGTKLNTFPTRIPVQAGDDIGEYFNHPTLASTDCGTTDTAYTDHYYFGDVPPNTTQTFFVEHVQQDVAAVLEPDADHDGYGDETQDQCPTDASTHGPCPAATGQRAAALKKCKKKHSAKKRRKCRRKAKLLPV